MSTQPQPNRVPAGVPTGGQFAASEKGEANLRLIEGEGAATEWRVPRDPFRPLLPGLSEAEDSEWRDLDEKAENGLTPDALTRSETERYLELAAKVGEPGTTQWLPQCPRHGGAEKQYGRDTGTWGADETCEACTNDGGEPRPLADRLTVIKRFTTEQIEAIHEERYARQVASAKNGVYGAFSQFSRWTRLDEDTYDRLDENDIEINDALYNAVREAQDRFAKDGDIERLRADIDVIAERADAYDDAFPNEYESAGEDVDRLRRAADDLETLL